MNSNRGSRRTRAPRLLDCLALALLLLAAACAGGGDDAQGGIGDGTRDATGEVIWRPPFPDAGAEVKPGGPDVREDVPDAVRRDLPAPPDVRPDTPVDPCGPDSPLFGPCRSNGDCEDGYCVWDPAAAAFVCTIFCVENCPCGWQCRAVAGTWPEVTSVCLPPIDRLCEPCATDADCINPSDLCLPIGNDPAQPSFCAKGCALSDDHCPGGYTCTDVTDGAGAPLGRQCLPDSGSCVCTAELLGTTRPCQRTNEFGTCRGDQECLGADGWGPCSAWEPAPESCNGVDDDCDGAQDEDFTYVDGARGVQRIGAACGLGVCAGGVVVCADAQRATCSSLQQQRAETCNELDDDCDGLTDEDVTTTFWQDQDGDGQGWAGLTWVGCQAPAGWVPNADDCDDYDRSTGLGFPELCDNRDNDCDGLTDDDIFWASPTGEQLPLRAPCGTGLCRGGIVICAGEAGAACSTSGYALPETCDGRDEDCDGVVDNTCDDDRDGYCDRNVMVAGLPAVCPLGPGDCADDDPDVHPGAPERCDGVDQDCDGQTDEDATDCPGRRCEGAGDDYFETGVAACQAGACVSPTPRGCRLYTCSGGGADGDRCAESCTDDRFCVASAHCDLKTGSCRGDVANGGPCDAPNECVSGHCQNGFCCAGGDCCGVAAHCPAAYRRPAVCDDPSTCQGRRGDALCAQSVCAPGPDADDDSACGPDLQAVDCTPFAPLFCTGEADQFPPACSDICAVDEDCVAGFHCDERCLPDRPDGGPCDEDSDCESGHCQNGFCCADGDCCQLAEDCPPQYGGAPFCESPGTCQGYRADAVCGEDNVCAMSDRIADDSGCTAQTEAIGCGWYASVFCNGTFDQRPPECPTACTADAECDPGAHCDGTCQPDVVSGGRCDEPSDCVSGYCNNGFCCGGGVCCGTLADCPPQFHDTPVCDDPATCQGSRIDATCIANVCGRSERLADDSGCGPTVLQSDCGLYADRYCTGAASQSVAPCPNLCGSDAGCDPGAHCDNVCVPDLPDGEGCDENSDCQSGHCRNGFCCGAGDCCAAASDCPAAYRAPAACDDPSTCQGHRTDARCQSNTCTTADVPDDSACTAGTLSDDCGRYRPVYCTGAVNQIDPGCPTSCVSDAECDPGAHCDGACVDDAGNGLPCDEPSDCVSGHCQNGYCCASGDCCATAQSCPAAYSAPSVCDSAATCQGHRISSTCLDNRCGSQSVDDDSGCAGLVSDTCGVYPTVYCTNAAAQSDPPCATTCGSDADCDANAHCDGGRCYLDLGPGETCDEPSDCQSSYCVDGVCCNSACTGTCRRCDLTGSRGTCSTTPWGQDPDSECGAIGCSSYYWGWSGETCYRRADVSAAAAACDGTGVCQTAAAVCGSQGQGTAQLTCPAPCKAPTGGTCTGTTAGTCTNQNPGNISCGTGACFREVPRCVNGSLNTCTPGNPVSETCNNVDDDCNGTVDDNIVSARDGYENNNACTSPYDLGTVAEELSEASWTATLYPAGDVDWFRFYADEANHTCFPGTSQSYTVRIRLEPPSGADCVDYDVYLFDDGCGTQLGRGYNGSCTAESFTYTWSGTCAFDDSRYFRVQVVGFGGAWECRTYRLYIDMY
jgi:hypothetical protein